MDMANAVATAVRYSKKGVDRAYKVSSVSSSLGKTGKRYRKKG